MKIAIIADTHVNPEDGVSSSVYGVHANANMRVLAAIDKINTLGVELIVHLGDFVHRIQGQPFRNEAIHRFRKILGTSGVPVLLVPGNHDEGEKVTPWAPGHPVTPATLKQYRADFGPDYYLTDLIDARLITLNSQLFGHDNEEEHTQLTFLEKALATSKPTYVFQHHPFYLENPKEPEHYDNLPLVVRDRYLPMLTGAGVRGIFAGHVHNFFFNILADTQCFVVPSTTFVRHDYTELFPFVPNDEAHGRNYASKLGFFLLETIEGHSVATWVRTFGCAVPSEAKELITLPSANLLRGDHASVGVDLRHDWATPRPIPYTALQDEFNRKHIRNDYFTASVFETAVRLLRVPMQDIEEPQVNKRMHDLARVGVKFVVFLYESPNLDQVRLLNGSRQVIEAVEICASLERLAPVSAMIREGGLHESIRLIFAEMGTSAAGTEAMAHYIWTGFDGTRNTVAEYLMLVRKHGFSGGVLRLERGAVNPKCIDKLADTTRAAGTHSTLYVRLASTNGAEAEVDDASTARLVATVEVMARLYKRQLTIILDTYSDHDRGYYPRTGLVDRAYDLRPAGIAISRITGLLGAEPLRALVVENEFIRFSSSKSAFLFIPNPQVIGGAILPEVLNSAIFGVARLHRLWMASAESEFYDLRALQSHLISLSGPVLVEWERSL